MLPGPTFQISSLHPRLHLQTEQTPVSLFLAALSHYSMERFTSVERADDSEPLDGPAASAHHLPHRDTEAAPGKVVHISEHVLGLSGAAEKRCPGPTTGLCTADERRAQPPCTEQPCRGSTPRWGLKSPAVQPLTVTAGAAQ